MQRNLLSGGSWDHTPGGGASLLHRGGVTGQILPDAGHGHFFDDRGTVAHLWL